MQRLRDRIAEEGHDLQPLTGAQLRAVNRRERKNAGLGGDAWSPEALALLPDEAWDDLASLLNQCEQTGTFPLQLLANVVALIPKPDEGERPITLLPYLIRLWGKARGS